MVTPARSNPWKIGFLILAIAVILWLGYAFTVPRLAMSWEKSNQFGGMFGGIGALFSGLALAGVVVAILMQKEELELQREELKATREELRRTAEAQEAAAKTTREQATLLLATARLNAMSTIVHFHSTPSFFAEPATASAYEKKIKSLLTELEAAAH